MTTFIQRNFAGGEISPSLYARVDTQKYATALRTMLNFMVQKWGGAATRPGTQLVAETKDPSKTVRLIPFVFNNDQTYVLEFGDEYMRVHKGGALLTDPATAKTVSAITNADPANVTTSVAHGYSDGDEVVITGISGMVELEGRQLKVDSPGASDFDLLYMDDATSVDATGFGTFSGTASVEKVYEIVTPYLEAELQELQFVQSADVVTIVHPNHPPMDLARTGDTAWTLTEITFAPRLAFPENLALSGGVAGGPSRYKVTAVDLRTGEESLPGRAPTVAITGLDFTGGLLTVATGGHSFLEGDEVYIDGLVGGGEELNDRAYIVATPITATEFDLRDVDGTAISAWSSGGDVGRTFIQIGMDPDSGTPIDVDWDAVTGADEYNVYREIDGVYGFIGTSKRPASPAFSDDDITPDTTFSPPVSRNPFKIAGNYPSAVAYYQQRKMFANSDNNPERIWASVTGDFDNFGIHTPLIDSDSVQFELAGRQVNEVRHMVDLDPLVVLTTGGEFKINGDDAGTLTPIRINAKQQSYNGAASLRPVLINGTAVYVQARGSVVRDLKFSFASDRYEGDDLTIFAYHLFEGFSLRDWSYQQIPNSILWAVRGDGVLLGLTYLPEHQVWGWHRHTFQGDTVEQIAVVPEGGEDVLYLLIKRTVTGLSSLGGSTRRYIERLTTRQITNIVDYVAVDSSLSYDGRHTGVTTMTLSGGPPWTGGSTLTLTASVATFASSDVGNEVHLTGSDGTEIRFEITGFTSPTVVTGRPHKDVPVSMQGVAITTWALAVDEIGGLWHLEGEQISVFGDGFVEANPNNDAYTVLTVAGGKVTLSKPYAVVHAGLPYLCDFETLDIDTVEGETVVDKAKRINEVILYVEKSRGVFAGPDFDNLTELKIRNEESMDDPVALATREVEITVTGDWNSHGRIAVRQVDPVPLAILSASPRGLVPFRG